MPRRRAASTAPVNKTERVLEVSLSYDSLDAAISQLQGLKETYGPSYPGGLELRLEQQDYSESYSLFLYGIRPETDAETQERIETEARYREQRKAQYERLKREFGG